MAKKKKEETIESDSTIKFMDRTTHKLNVKGKNVKENNNGGETLTEFLKRILTTLGAFFRTWTHMQPHVR